MAWRTLPPPFAKGGVYGSDPDHVADVSCAGESAAPTLPASSASETQPLCFRTGKGTARAGAGRQSIPARSAGERTDLRGTPQPLGVLWRQARRDCRSRGASAGCDAAGVDRRTPSPAPNPAQPARFYASQTHCRTSRTGTLRTTVYPGYSSGNQHQRARAVTPSAQTGNLRPGPPAGGSMDYRARPSGFGPTIAVGGMRFLISTTFRERWWMSTVASFAEGPLKLSIG